MVLLSFTGERPQLFSFLYLALVLLLFDTCRQTNRRWLLFVIPPIFILWTNTHGAVLFGLAALALYGLGAILQTRLTGGKFDAAEIKLILGVVVLSTIASFIAPNGIATHITTLKTLIFSENSLLRARTSEYATPWAMRSLLSYYWVFLAMVLVSLYGLRGRANVSRALFVVVIAAFSLTGSRYVPLFTLAVAPYIAFGLSRTFPTVQPPMLPICLATTVISLGFLGYGFKQGAVFQGGMQESKYPVQAVRIINDEHMAGKLFNTLNFGGYLDWNLPASTARIFIDGRLLDIDRGRLIFNGPMDIDRLIPYTNILWMTPAGRDYFERASFDMVLVSPGNVYTGESYPLVQYLLGNPLWRLAQNEPNSLFFVRAGAGS